MVDARHKAQTIAEGIHTPISFEYANEAARLAAGPFESYDKNKFALQLDTNEIYVLTDTFPIVWRTVSGPAISGDLDMDGYNIIDVGTVDGVDVSSHADRHEQGGPDAIEISDLGTSELDAGMVLKPDGAGGVVWGAGAGAVSSVFSRVGDVVAEIDDYSASQIDNDSTVTGAQVSDALDYLDGYVASVAQDVADIATMTVGGDLSGNLPNPSVVDLSITGEEQGSVLYFDGGNWVQLPPGTDGYALITHDTGANPTWGEVASSAPVTSVFSRVGDVVAAIDDYSASQIDNDSTVPGEQVSDALEYLDGYVDHAGRHENGGPDEIEISNLGTSENNPLLVLKPDGFGGVVWSVAAGGGDVVGPAGATDSAVALFDGGTGKVLKNSLVTIDGAGNISTPGMVDGYYLWSEFYDINVQLDILGGALGGDLSGTLPNPTVTDLTITSEEQGSVLYFDGANWVQLPPGTDGYALITHDTGANPTWEEVGGSSPVTSVFSRVGDVIAAVDDYSASQIDNDSTVPGEQVSDALEYLSAIIDFDGYVVGPASATDDAVALFDGLTGKIIKNSLVTIDGSGNISTPGMVDGYYLGTEFYDINAQLDILGGILGGDLSGTLPNPSVVDLSIAGEEQGSVLYFDGANWVQLPPGEDGYALITHDTGANPTWGEVATTAPVTSVFGRVGDVVAAIDDYSASQIENDSTVSGEQVSDALEYLDGYVDHAERHEYDGGDPVDGYQIGLVYTPVNYDPPGTNIIGEHIAEIDNALGEIVGTGYVVGPAISTDNAIVRYDGITGELVQNSGVLIDNSDNISGAVSLAMGNKPAQTGAIRLTNNEGIYWAGTTEMSFPGDRKYKLQIDIQQSLVTGDPVNDLWVRITHQSLPDAMLTSGGAYAPKADGGDIGASLDEFGNTRIPLYVVRCDLDLNPANSRVQIWVRRQDVSDVVDTPIWLWWGDAAATPPATNEPYGRDDVFGSTTGTGAPPDGFGVWLFDEDPAGPSPQYKDHTGNGRDATVGGTITRVDAMDVRGAQRVYGGANAINTAFTWNTGTNDFTILQAGILNAGGYFTIGDGGGTAVFTGTGGFELYYGGSSREWSVAVGTSSHATSVVRDGDAVSLRVNSNTTNGAGWAAITDSWVNPGLVAGAWGGGTTIHTFKAFIDTALNEYWTLAWYQCIINETNFLVAGTIEEATPAVNNVRGLIVDPSNNIVLGDADYPLVGNATDSITFNVDGYEVLAVYDGYVEITGDLTVSGDINGSVGGDLSGSLPNPLVTDLTITAEEQGSILYFDGANWVQLPPGADGYALITHDTGANPTWGEVAGSSPVTSVFSRVGDVVAGIDDYSASQVDNDSTVTGEQVSDALEYLDGYIGDVYTLPVGGDLSGNLPNPLVTDLTITGEEQGSVLYYNGGNWVQLPPGEDGYVLTTRDTGANPEWAMEVLKLDQTNPQTVVNGRPTINDGLNFGTSPVIGDFVSGKLYYDVLWRTLSLESGRDVTLQIGQEEWRRVYNNTGSTILNGKAVYTSGVWNGSLPYVATVGLAIANDAAKWQVLGIATQDIDDGEYGFISVRGHVNGVNTDSWTAGDVLYLSDTVAGELSNALPTSGNYKVRVGRVIRKDATEGVINVRIIANAKLGDLANVVVTSASLDQVLTFNGVEWVNGNPASSSASPGIDFFNSTPVITARTAPAGLSQDGTAGNGIQINSLSKTPVTTAEQTQTILASADTRAGAAWLYDTALGRTTIDAGLWDFTTYVSVSNTGGTNTVTRTVYQVVPGTGTLSFTGGGANSRTATITTAQYDGTYFVPSGTQTLASFIQATSGTNKGMYQITAMTDPAKMVATVTVRTGYVNESGVTYNIWNRLFSVTTVTLISTSLSQYDTVTSQPAFTIAATDKLGSMIFVTASGANRTFTIAYNGTERNTHVSTPLITLHNNLSGLQGGSANERYHISAAQYTVVGNTSGTNTGDNAVNSNYANDYRPGGTDVPVADGGTGLSAIAAGSILAANTANVLSAVTSAVGTTFLKNTAGTVSWGDISVNASQVDNDSTVPGAQVSDALEYLDGYVNHADRHEYGGGDPIDGYQIGLVYAPVNYDPPATDIIGEHIAGIDNALGEIVGTGYVVGPAIATDNGIARYDGTTGELVQNSGVLVDNSDNISGVESLSVGATPAQTGAIRLTNNEGIYWAGTTETDFPGDRAYKLKLTIPNETILGDIVNDGLFRVTHISLPDAFLTLNGPQAPQNGGTDIAASLDEFGNTRIPCYVVRCDLDATPANSRVQLWVRRQDVSDVADTDIWLWWGSETATAPAVDADYGRNDVFDGTTGTGSPVAAWGVWLFDEDPSDPDPCYKDVSGNGHGATDGGTVTRVDAMDVRGAQCVDPQGWITASHAWAPGTGDFSILWAGVRGVESYSQCVFCYMGGTVTIANIGGGSRKRTRAAGGHWYWSRLCS